MIPSFVDQVNNFFKSMDIKYPEGDQLFVGCSNGYLLKFSMIAKKNIYDFAKILNDHIMSMAKTLDNKSQFVCDNSGLFLECDISTCKQVNNFKVNSVTRCVITYDNKFFITVGSGYDCVLTKWSVRTKKQLHNWQCGIDSRVFSQSCSYDNKYQLIGYNSGWLGIFDLQKTPNTQTYSSFVKLYSLNGLFT